LLLEKKNEIVRY